MLSLVLVAVLSQATPKDVPVAKPNPQTQTAQPAQPVPPPISVTVTSPPQSEEEKRQETERTERDVEAQETMARFTRALFWLSVLQAIAALAAVIAAFKAVTVGRNTVTAMGHTDRHFRYAERAYVGIHHRQAGDTDDSWDFSFHPTKKSGGKPEPDGSMLYRLDLKVANSGQTPAQVHGGGVCVVPALARVPFSWPTIEEMVPTRGHIPGNLLHAGDNYRVKITLALGGTRFARPQKPGVVGCWVR